ncbi:MAG TPA: hypothetical protein VFN92_02070 [Solirubrobacterales bacterium]|nr:hypothetical protein [Solirubrobacterales bacterium]
MSGDKLDRALWDAAIPEPPAAEERGRQIVAAAFAQREGGDRGGRSELRGGRTPQTSEGQGRRSLPRLALGLSLATLLAALLLSPAGAAVRDWVDDALTTGAPPPEPTLARVPGGGRLLVQTGEGPVVVEPDGARRLLGDYESASWSPRGLFVVVARGRTLSALEPDGTPRWSLTSEKRVAFPGRLMAAPSWSPSGERIAYRSGSDLRVIAGDGTQDRLLAGSIAAGSPPREGVSPAFSPAWSPTGENELAYVTGAGRLQILDSETGAVLTGAPALRRIAEMDWADGGRKILEASRGTIRLRPVLPAGHPSRPALGKARRLPVPPGATVNDVDLAPQSPLVAASVTYWRKHGTYGEVLIYRPGQSPQTLLRVPGSLWQVEWSPDGKRLFVAWPGADQWLFLPLGRGEGRAFSHISRTIAPSGRPTSFPQLEGWCCRR